MTARMRQTSPDLGLRLTSPNAGMALAVTRLMLGRLAAER
jgi:hypothetical protein